MEVKDLNRDSKFRFECGPHLACFKECCRKLRLVLTPYDCLKLKGYLGLHSDDFLERYCDLIYEDGIFPFYYLRMAEDGVCPFLGEEECKVYPARPSA
ncbi:MAG: YkgJ family cysteine cluster protein, partial [Desulfatiglandales bacterium]